MADDRWTAVDDYLNHLLIPADPVLEEALRASEAAELPALQVTPTQGKLLYLLARIQRARAILEIGTLGGYSTIWLARALPADGFLITLERDPKHAAIARANLARAGLDGQVDLRLGPALETLPQVEADGRGPFDLVFIDANKPDNAEYFAWALRLTRRGGLIITDNVIRNGAVVDAQSSDPSVQGTRRFYEQLAAESRVEATAVQTVGAKGYDGFAVALVTADPPPH